MGFSIHTTKLGRCSTSVAVAARTVLPYAPRGSTVRKTVWADVGKSRPQESAQGDKWSFCLTAGCATAAPSASQNLPLLGCVSSPQRCSGRARGPRACRKKTERPIPISRHPSAMETPCRASLINIGRQNAPRPHDRAGPCVASSGAAERRTGAMLGDMQLRSHLLDAGTATRGP